MKRWVLISVGLVACGGIGYAVGYARGTDAITPEEQAAHEAAFSRSMAGVVLEGDFTVDASEQDGTRNERYTIERVERMAGDVWLFHARIEFGDTDVTLPVPVRVLWAGDTPVVSLTDAAIPGLGTFSARIVFYGDRYAGMWSNPSTGGFQFGKLSRATD